MTDSSSLFSHGSAHPQSSLYPTDHSGMFLLGPKKHSRRSTGFVKDSRITYREWSPLQVSEVVKIHRLNDSLISLIHFRQIKMDFKEKAGRIGTNSIFSMFNCSVLNKIENFKWTGHVSLHGSRI